MHNCSTVKSTISGGQNGLASIAEHPAQHQLRTGHAFFQPNDTGDNPVCPAVATSQEQEHIKNVHNKNPQNYLSCQCTETLCLSVLETTIKEMHLGEIWTPKHGFGNRNPLGVLEWLHQIHGHIGPGEVTANQERLMMSIDPKLPAVHTFKQIEDCDKFATAAGTPFTVQQCLKTAKQLVLQQGQCRQAQSKHFALPEVNETHLAFDSLSMSLKDMSSRGSKCVSARHVVDMLQHVVLACCNTSLIVFVKSVPMCCNIQNVASC